MLTITKREELEERFSNQLVVAPELSRQLVSFQASKVQPVYRWFKYKEGFSPNLVRHFLKKYAKSPGKILDPFAGTGTTLFTANQEGWDALGIELLPVGAFSIEVRKALQLLDISEFEKQVKSVWSNLKTTSFENAHIQHISITKDAFPVETEELINKYLELCLNIEDKNVAMLMKFAAFCVLEEISFTRKDGQYLRWDYRSIRKLNGKSFNKGEIKTFQIAVSSKLEQMLQDVKAPISYDLFSELGNNKGISNAEVDVIIGSCLYELPNIETGSIDMTITSPPYCNRYDYTRTYALELIFLGLDNEKVKELRQNMLSCTVENKEKVLAMKEFYSGKGLDKSFNDVMKVYEDVEAMSEVNALLESFKDIGKLNNNGIARMVKNYFLEMCFVIYELARVTRKNGYCIMVNDNVKYVGEEIPVDIILSEFASKFGFEVENILVLPKGKGNSSQQMGNFGRTEIRKCVYVWRRK